MSSLHFLVLLIRVVLNENMLCVNILPSTMLLKLTFFHEGDGYLRKGFRMNTKKIFFQLYFFKISVYFYGIHFF